jgi:ATP phosphoribosyltransferase
MTRETITIALPKGRLLAPAIRLFGRCGMKHRGLQTDTRRLVFENHGQSWRFVIMRDRDVPTYVEYGAADMGIVGKDILLEQDRDVYEPLDLKFGECRLVLAQPNGVGKGHGSRSLSSKIRVATKYPKITERYFSERGLPVEIIKLYGSIEIAPWAGLAEQIVDLIATGRTLRANRLSVVETIVESTARLIVNRASLKLKYQQATELIARLREKTETDGRLR